MSSELPSDLLIFSPEVVIQALCSQYDANGCLAARDWACSFSWCGNRRSTPPPWMSKAGPRYLPAIAEHSMCHPGRPGPQGLGQAAVSGSESFFQPFHKQRSRGGRACRMRVGVLGRLHVVEALVGELAVRRPRPHVEVHVARAVLGRVGVALGDQGRDQLDHLEDVSRGARLVGRRQHVDRGQGLVELAVHVVREVEPGASCSADFVRILSSMSVTLRMNVTSYPWWVSHRRSTSKLTADRTCPTCGSDCTVRPQT